MTTHRVKDPVGAPDPASDVDYIVGRAAPVLVTGAAGFIGAQVVATLLRYGFTDVRCLVRSASRATSLRTVIETETRGPDRATLLEGTLLSRSDCERACQGVAVVYHLAAAVEKSFSGSFLNTVVATRNLVEAARARADFRRFVQVSSFAVYSNWGLRRGGTLDEHCPLEQDPAGRHEPYCYAKLHEDRLLQRYMTQGFPAVIVRPGAVYGPRSRQSLSPRIGIDTFGVFLHLGGRNQIPLAYVDNCAEAVVRAGLIPGIEGEVFNVVDDDLPSSRDFLRLYKRNVHRFSSLYVPYPLFYAFSAVWERYSQWSKGQLPPVFNRRRCAAYWKSTRYTNDKAKRLLGWRPRVSFREAALHHFTYFRSVSGHADG